LTPPVSDDNGRHIGREHVGAAERVYVQQPRRPTVRALQRFSIDLIVGCDADRIIILLSFTVVGVANGATPTLPPAPSLQQQSTPMVISNTPPHPTVYRPKTENVPQSNPSPYGNYGQSSGGSYSGSANSRPVVRDESDNGVMPISSLTPYTNRFLIVDLNFLIDALHRWTIKARITNKSDIRRWSNQKGEGTLFSIDLLDASGGEIRGTFFKETCEKWFPILELHKVCAFCCLFF
jgi:hypothetical protein